jgi:photosystem II stability/assembly factor-like uncharacterized protein
VRVAAIPLLAAAAVAAAAALADPVQPDSGPVPARMKNRLLHADGARAGNRVVAIGDHGYIVVSDDGASWRRAKSPRSPLLTALQFVDDKRGWAVGHDAVILATADGGESWQMQFSAPKEQRPLLGVLFLDDKRGMAVGAYGAFYETADGGARWAARKVIEDDKHLNAIVDLGKGQLLIVGESGTLLRSGDSGATWKPVASPYKGSFFGAAVARDGSVAAFGLRGHVFRSADGGNTWAAVKTSTEAALAGATVLADGTMVLVGNAGTLLTSRDNGQSFTAIPTGRRHALARALPGKADSVLVLGEGGMTEVSLRPPK